MTSQKTTIFSCSPGKGYGRTIKGENSEMVTDPCQINAIHRLRHEEKWSFCKTAREPHLAQKTIKKYLLSPAGDCAADGAGSSRIPPPRFHGPRIMFNFSANNLTLFSRAECASCFVFVMKDHHTRNLGTLPISPGSGPRPQARNNAKHAACWGGSPSGIVRKRTDPDVAWLDHDKLALNGFGLLVNQLKASVAWMSAGVSRG